MRTVAVAGPDEREQEQRRHLHQGFGAALTNSAEIAAVPLILAGLGWLVDALLGTEPVFVAVFAVLGLVGTFAKLYYAYCHTMTSLEAAGPWHRNCRIPQ